MESRAYLEIIHSPYFLMNKKIWAKGLLLAAAQKAVNHESGWSIGICLSREDAKPKATRFGLKAAIKSREGDRYDYWELHHDGKFYFMRTLEEDFKNWKDKHQLHFDTRIRRATEALLHCKNLYSELGVDSDQTIHFHINVYGIKGRTLSALNPERELSSSYVCEEEKHEFFKPLSINLITTDIKGIIYEMTKDLFELFNFFHYKQIISDQIIDKYLAGKN